jgi:ABC-type Fe3+/spermidine/putrescine transport system ATPase subunit
MHAGRIAQVGAPREIYERPRSKEAAALVGEANFLQGKLIDQRAVDTPVGRLLCADAGNQPPNAEVTVCIRPEHIRFGSGSANAIEATIAGQSYHGERAQWSLSCRGVSLVANETAPGHHADGDAVTCWVDPAHVVVMGR